MIPKIIHYCWFGHNPLPALAQKCIKSWEKHCPDFQIIEWNEDNYDLSSAPLYVRQAYEAKKWAFVTDYVRLQVVYENGGVYLDTDVEILKPLESLLSYDAYFGFEMEQNVNTGLGFGAIKGHTIVKELMQDYLEIPFALADGTYDTKPCPIRNTEIFLRHGLAQTDTKQVLDNNVCVLPTRFLCPLFIRSARPQIENDTISIHWYSASWVDAYQRRRYHHPVFYRIIDGAKMVLKKIIGPDVYLKIKRLFIKQ